MRVRGPGPLPLDGVAGFVEEPSFYPYLSGRANLGCYKADAPPSFIGQQRMKVPGGKTVVNPLFTIYGCFDTL